MSSMDLSMEMAVNITNSLCPVLLKKRPNLIKCKTLNFWIKGVWCIKITISREMYLTQ